jgi:hypothetical protein
VQFINLRYLFQLFYNKKDNMFINIREGADKSLARSTYRCRRTESLVSFGKRGQSVCWFASLFLLQRLKRSMSGDARDLNNIEALYDIFPKLFDLHWPPTGRWLTKRRIRGLLRHRCKVKMLCSCLNKYCENFSSFSMVNRNWKCWIVTVTYCKRCYKKHTRLMDVLIHSDTWSLFIMAIVRKGNLLEWKDLLTLQKNLELQIFYFTQHRSPEYRSL